MPRYYDDDSDDDIDRDPDERYRRRVDRFGEDLTPEEEDRQEQEDAESAAVARKRSLWPGLLMIVAAALTLLGTAGLVAYLVGGPTATGGAGAVVGMMGLVFCGGLPLLFTLAFCVLELVGGICLIRLRGRGMAMAGGILGGMAVVPVVVVWMMVNYAASGWLALGPALLGIPAAIWMFVTLSDADVQDAFERNKKYV
jgi:hypothetical protein